METQGMVDQEQAFHSLTQTKALVQNNSNTKQILEVRKRLNIFYEKKDWMLLVGISSSTNKRFFRYHLGIELR